MVVVTAYLAMLWIGLMTVLGRWHGGAGWIAPAVIAVLMGLLTWLGIREADDLSTATGSSHTGSRRPLRWKRYLLRLVPRTAVVCLLLAAIDGLGGKRVEHFWAYLLLMIPFVAVFDGVWYFLELAWASFRSRLTRAA